METFLETLAGLARDGKTDRAGKPNLLQQAVIGQAFSKEIYNANIPLLLLRILIPVLAPFGRLLGYRARYAKYSGTA